MAEKGKLAVIGYRALRYDKFFSILADADVKVLLDVRRNPYSPNPDYQRANLGDAAQQYKVRYFHVPQLGVPGAGKSPIPDGEPRTFDEQMETPEAEEALQKILRLTSKGHNVALMCSEPNYLDCHRRHLVRMLQERDPELELLKLTAATEQRLF